MSTAVESTRAFQGELDDRLTGHGSDSPADWLGTLRRTAAGRFSEVGFPGPRDENWKYTSAGAILRNRYRSANGPAALSATELETILAGVAGLDGAAAVVVLVDGWLVAEASRGLDGDEAAGGGSAANLDGLASLTQHSADLIQDRLGRYLDASAGGFTALNGARLDDGVVVRVPRGKAVEAPLHIVHVATASAQADSETGGESGDAHQPIASHPRNLIVLEAGSSARVVEHYVGMPGVHLTNAATEIVLERDAVLSHLKLQCEAPEAFHVQRIQVQQEAGSRFTSHSFAFGARLSRTEIHSTLAGEQAECSLYGLYVAGGTGHVDHHTTVDHAVAGTRSRELYKGILDDRARGVFTGKVLVRRDAQQISAEQSNKNLLLADGAVAQTRPQLEIYADDVKCSHGAAIGRLDDDALFYLRQRGIGAAEARILMTQGFGMEITETIEDEALASAVQTVARERIERAIGAGESS